MVTRKWWKRNLAAATITAALVGIAAAPSTAAEVEFKDVPSTHKYYNVINDLAELDIVSGYSDGTFKLGNQLLRAEAAQIFTGILDLEAGDAETPFTDVEADKWYTDAISAMYEAGHIKGYNNEFNPHREISRAEFAQMLVSAYEIPETDTALPFSDVEEGDWYESAVRTLYANKLISGLSIDKFGPNEPIKRGDAVWLLANTDYIFGEKLPKPPFTLSIMHSNDTHANLNDVAKKVTAVKEVRFAKPHALLLDAGDVMSGTLYFNEFQGKADLEFMNLMGYDAMTFGNHEFDLGSTPEGHKALAEFVEAAKFPFVSANVNFGQDEKFTGLFSDLVSSEPENGKIYNGIVKEIKGQKVGIFGLTTPETADLSSPGKITFDDYIAEAEKAVKAFEDMGVDVIVALTHIGYDDNPEVDNDLELAARVDGIDVIVGGHSHTTLAEPVLVKEDENGAAKNPTVIVQTGANNSNLGTLDVVFDENGTVVSADGELLSIGDFEADSEAAKLLEKYSTRVKEVSDQEIGVELTQTLENPRLGDEGNDGVSVRNSETILGNLIADGMLAKAKEYDENVVMAFQNGGGIRAAINAGPITVGEVITVLPYNNTLALMEITGADLKAAFEISFKEYPNENGGFLHVAGAKVEFDSSKPAGERVVKISYKDASGNYVEIEDSATYMVATNAFTAKGGDGYDVFAKLYEAGKVTDLGLSDWENFRDHLVSLEEIPTATEGRIVDVSAK